jgi:hypothetical protein
MAQNQELIELQYFLCWIQLENYLTDCKSFYSLKHAPRLCSRTNGATLTHANLNLNDPEA